MIKKRLFTAGLIMIGLAIAIFFGINTLHAFKQMRGHGPFKGKPPTANQTDVELIRDWMTVPYIANTYDVPPDALFFGLGLKPEKHNGRKSLQQLNDEYFPDQPGVVLLQVRDSIKAFQAQTLPPPPLLPQPTITP
jgi:hypothetical protein